MGLHLDNVTNDDLLTIPYQMILGNGHRQIGLDFPCRDANVLDAADFQPSQRQPMRQDFDWHVDIYVIL